MRVSMADTSFPRSPRRCVRFAAQSPTCSWRRATPLTARALIATSELATNAIEHASGKSDEIEMTCVHTRIVRNKRIHRAGGVLVHHPRELSASAYSPQERLRPTHAPCSVQKRKLVQARRKSKKARQEVAAVCGTCRRERGWCDLQAEPSFGTRQVVHGWYTRGASPASVRDCAVPSVQALRRTSRGPTP
jgi:hypothetical protein